MTTQSKSVAMYWALFVLSGLACVAFLFFKPEWCWVTFPFIGVFFVRGLDWI